MNGVERMSAEEKLERARLFYERAVFDGEAGVLEVADRELDAIEAGLALARGRIMHARFFEDGEEDPRELALFERATELYRALGDLRGESESLLWIGLLHQVVRRDDDTAVPFLERSHELAVRAGDKLLMSYALRHLGTAEHAAGRLETARERLEESVRLRRELGFLPGVAANLVGLIYIAAAEGRRDDALALAEEGSALAEAAGAKNIARQIEEARTRV